ncbi:MAG: hypothetical protein IJW99_07150 [Clostridia bacterium]|nr:hypothetical protein [Clostridia bacterium]
MEYIKQSDYDYIINKYHDTSKPFDPFKRFIRHDAIFAPETGMDGEAIKENILLEDEKIRELPHPVRKARAFAYILKNTRISCDRRDRFPAINAIDRPLNATLIARWKREIFSDTVPEVEEERKRLERDGIVTIWPDYDHTVPLWERIFSLGFAGLLRESEEARVAAALTPAQDAFFEGIRITYEAIIDFTGRLEALAAATEGSERMARALHRIRYGAPATFYECLLVNYIYFMLCEHMEGLQVRSLSNFDRILYPFCQRDLASGVSEEEIRRDLAYYFLQFTAIGNYWNQPVYLGGCREDGSTQINALSYLFLDVYDRMGIYNPKIQLKIAESTPKAFIQKALDMVRRGRNSIVFVSDSTIRRALIRTGASEEEARLCDIKGCYEYSLQGSFGCGMNYLNLLKPMEYALHGGRDGVTGKPAGLPCPDAADYPSFEAFYEEYKRQLRHVIETTVRVVNGFEDHLACINPQSMISATFPSCLAQGRDAIGGGAVRNGSTLSFGFLADITDSLTMIRKHVFDRRALTLTRLVGMLDRNFEGDELWRRRMVADREKFGNNKERPDALAADLVDFITKCVVGRPNAPTRGGTWNCSFHVARMSYTQGKKTAASPNGRLLGEELSKNCSASMGQNREGATAAILSTTKIDATAFTGDACLDVGLLPSAVRGEDGLEAMYGLLTAFTRRGGHALQFNVFDADTLRNAQAQPEKYRDLQIRVCGWNVLWNNISRVEQDGFIRQAESLV